MEGSAEVEKFKRNFDEKFCLISCMESTIGSSIWYINSRSSSLMSGQKTFFKYLEEGGIGIHVEFGYDARY